jgi:hypothetical protein
MDDVWCICPTQDISACLGLRSKPDALPSRDKFLRVRVEPSMHVAWCQGLCSRKQSVSNRGTMQELFNAVDLNPQGA